MRGWFGPEWNPVLAVLAVLAGGALLATLHWWLGLVFVGACIVAGLVAAYVGEL